MLRSYECMVPGYNFSRIIDAETAGKARYRYLLYLQDAYENATFTDIKVRSLGFIADKRSPAEIEVDDFNAKYPLGTFVRYWRGCKEGKPSGSGRTRTTAQIMCDHGSVWIEGCRGSISLSHVEVIE